jgi:hypothetical protein
MAPRPSFGTQRRSDYDHRRVRRRRGLAPPQSLGRFFFPGGRPGPRLRATAAFLPRTLFFGAMTDLQWFLQTAMRSPDRRSLESPGNFANRFLPILVGAIRHVAQDARLAPR